MSTIIIIIIKRNMTLLGWMVLKICRSSFFLDTRYSIFIYFFCVYEIESGQVELLQTNLMWCINDQKSPVYIHNVFSKFVTTEINKFVT